jgi:hypothetical protein
VFVTQAEQDYVMCPKKEDLEDGTISKCHNPTNNPKQLKTILLGWYYYRLKKPKNTLPGLITVRAVLGNLGS